MSKINYFPKVIFYFNLATGQLFNIHLYFWLSISDSYCKRVKEATPAERRKKTQLALTIYGYLCKDGKK